MIVSERHLNYIRFDTRIRGLFFGVGAQFRLDRRGAPLSPSPSHRPNGGEGDVTAKAEGAEPICRNASRRSRWA